MVNWKGKGQLPILFGTAVFDSYSVDFSCPLCMPPPASIIQVCFARQMHSTSQSDKTVLSKCVRVCVSVCAKSLSV
jgi:hypothetical protein